MTGLKSEIQPAREGRGCKGFDAGVEKIKQAGFVSKGGLADGLAATVNFSVRRLFDRLILRKRRLDHAFNGEERSPSLLVLRFRHKKFPQ